ncbi:MAG TPA: DUF58 domain-containing protein [Candidatus Limnocylindrales bacterium]|nr:DUF58 domain-containing protein [Candidatus Limnocylindrales bacterium]
MDVRLGAHPSARVLAYPGIAGVALLGGLALQRPELIVLAVPFLGALLVAALGRSEHRVRVSMAVPQARVLEGDQAVVEMTLSSEEGARALEVTLELEPGIELGGGRVHRVTLPPGHPVGLRLQVTANRWGLYDVSRLRLRWRDPLWLLPQEGSAGFGLVLRVYPRPEALRALIRPAETQVFAGNQVARARGDGIEFAEIRAYVPGDRVRHINWHATGRRGALQVNDLHPERNSEVILFLDTFGTYGEPPQRTLDRTLRAAIGFADLYLRHRDRVGVIAFGGVLRWLTPGMGIRQRYRLVEAILDTRVQMSYAWKSIETIPARTLPPKALIIALTPLVDERIAAALDQLIGRGFDLMICEVAPTPPVVPGDPVGALAARLLALRRDTLRGRYHRVGVAAVEWAASRPLQESLEEVRTFRRHARRRSA